MQGAMVQSGMSGTSVVATPRNDFEANVLVQTPAEAHARLHWIIFAAPTAWLALGLLLAASGMVLEVIGGLTFLYAVGAIVSACFNYSSSDFSATRDQLMIQTGFIQRSTTEIQLDAIKGIQLRQGLLGHLLGFGSITVSGVGAGGEWEYVYHRVSSPATFCTQLERLSGANSAH